MADTTLTRQEWQDLENSLGLFHGGRKLLCDGYNITVEKCVSGNRIVYCWYVDNSWIGAYMDLDNEIGQKFGCPKHLWTMSKKGYADIVKILGKRQAKRCGFVREKKLSYYHHVFTSFRTLKNTWIKNCQSIEIVEE